VKLADLNSDGLIDIVIANSIYTQNATMSKIFINKGNLEFELTDDKLGEIDCETKWIDVTDIDNDGYYDLVLGNYNIANMIYKNDGHGNFTKTNNGILVNPTTAIAVADFNDDGFMDIVFGHNSGKSDGHYEVYLNNGAGLKSNLPPDPPATLSSKVDSDTVRLSWGPGFDSSGSTLQFTDSGQSIGHLNAARAAVADLDGDGHPDIILGNGEELRQASEIYFNDGNGQFAVSNQTFDAYFLRDMAIGDIDNDGDIDWVVATQGDGGKVLSNDGHGVFQIRQEIGAKEVYVRAVDLGDVDGDGDLDLLYGSIGNRIYLNDGHGVFSDSGQDLKDHYLTQAVRFVDLDGDGDLDFVQGNRIFQDYDSADRIFFNDGNGKFTDSGQRLGQWSTMDVALGDVDLDGDFDLVSICPLGGVNKLYLNDGKGIFTDSGQSLSPSSDINETHSVGFGDIEHDGDLDLLLADWNLGIKLFLNDGHGNYNISDITLGTGETADSVVCDIDLDGDLDILDAKKGGEGSKIYLNNQASTPQSTLKYNVRIGTTPGGNDIVSNIQYGSGLSSTGTAYSINNLKEGSYYWSVQAVDAGFKKSAWFPEQQFHIAAVPASPTIEPHPTVEPSPSIEPSPTTTPSPATTPEPTSESITESTPITNTEPASNTAPNISTSPASESHPPSSPNIWIRVGIIIAVAGSIALALGIWIVYHKRVKKRS
jgi:hypothetical protein